MGTTLIRKPSSDHGPSLPPHLYGEDYFLSACEGYEEFLHTHGEHLSRRLQAAFSVAEVRPGMRVLDVGCGRGEIVRHCARLGACAIGVDYAEAAVRLSADLLRRAGGLQAPAGLAQADAKFLPFASLVFDRVLMFDVVEHLFPWELRLALQEAYRVLKPGGMLVIHTAPNRWYDAYAYPLVRLVRTLQGLGHLYPPNPRALNVPINEAVHVNEQGPLGLWWALRRAGFRRVKVWLTTPPQNRQEGWILRALRHIAFRWIPFRWFFEREIFAVAVRPE
ncbi:MAG: class I SAM-dependent methyltransferase [Anaerolineae bacterium]|nr:class I SAM-dependent methyltransferase [Anaerolineae bacterium]